MNRFKMKIVGLATTVLLSAGALIAPLTASAVTIDELMAQIVALQAPTFGPARRARFNGGQVFPSLVP